MSLTLDIADMHGQSTTLPVHGVVERVEVLADADRTLNRNDTGKTFLVPVLAAGRQITLPAAANTPTGTYYKFITNGTLGNILTITEGAANMRGVIKAGGAGGTNDGLVDGGPSTNVLLNAAATAGNRLTIRSFPPSWHVEGKVHLLAHAAFS